MPDPAPVAPELDATVPFVRAVRALVRADADAASTALADAVAVLESAEADAGVAFVAEPEGSRLAGGFFQPRTGEVPLPDLMAAAVDPKAFGRLYEPCSKSKLEAELDRRVLSLLDTTQCLLAGTDFTNDHFVRAREGHVLAYSQRSWGALLAEWANAAGWRLDDGDEPWDALAFCYPSDELLTGYRTWSGAVKRVLRHKTRLAIASEGARS